MQFELCKTTQGGRLYSKLLDDGSRKGFVTCHSGGMHYDSGEGEFDALCDCEMERVESGYQVTKNGWHYSAQTQGEDRGTVGFGGLNGTQWLKFKIEGFCHYDGEFTDLLGPVDYSSEPTVYQKSVPIAPDHIDPTQRVVKSQLDWGNLWAPGEGEISCVWTVKARQMIDKIRINEQARSHINGLLESKSRDSECGFKIKLDFPDAVMQQIKQSFDPDSPVTLSDELGRLIAFMPLDIAFVDGVGGSRPLKKTFFTENGQDYLFIGLKLADMDALLPGDLIFDPAITQEAVAAQAGDVSESDGDGNALINSTAGRAGYSAGTAYRVGVQFTPAIPQGATTTGGSNYGRLKLYASGSYNVVSSPTVTVFGDDLDNSAVFAQYTGGPSRAGWVNTTASVDVGVISDPGDDNKFNGVNGFPVGSIVEEIVGRAGWVSSNRMSFKIEDDGGAGGSIGIMLFDGAGTEARFDAYYTAGGGGIGILAAHHYRNNTGSGL